MWHLIPDRLQIRRWKLVKRETRLEVSSEWLWNSSQKRNTAVKMCCHRDSNLRSRTCKTGMLTTTPRQLRLRNRTESNQNTPWTCVSWKNYHLDIFLNRQMSRWQFFSREDDSKCCKSDDNVMRFDWLYRVGIGSECNCWYSFVFGVVFSICWNTKLLAMTRKLYEISTEDIFSDTLSDSMY